MTHRLYTRLAGLALACLTLTTTAFAQTATPPATQEEALTSLRKDVEGIAVQMMSARAKPPVTNAARQLDLGIYGELLGSALARARVIKMRGQASAIMIQAEQSRTDEQGGSRAGAAGSTTLVTKGGIPAVIGLAVENGALTQAVSGTTISLSGNPVGIVQALENKGFVATAGLSDPVLQALGRISFSVAFDASRGQTTPTFTGSTQQLSQWSVRGELVNRRDPRRSALWQSIPTLTTVVRAQGKWIDTAEDSDAFKGWLEPLQASVASLTTTATIRDAILEALDRFDFSKMDTKTTTALGEFGTAISNFEAQRKELLDQVKKGLLVTVEYVDNRPATGPETSNVTFIAERGSSNADFTFNAAATLINGALPAGTPDRLRDFSAAVQYDAPLRLGPEFGTFVFSLSGKYQYLAQDPSVAVKTPATPSGSIALAQATFTIPLGASGAKVPLSISWSNRTELIQEKQVRGNIGITYDLDAIFARRP